MRLSTLFSPSAVADRIRFAARCFRQRGALQWVVDDAELARELHAARAAVKNYCRNRELLDWIVDDRRFAEELYAARDRVKTYFVSKWDLTKIAFNEGTIFEEEQPLLRELVEAANSLPGPIVEIGTLFGSTTTLLALWKSPRKRIITVDNYSWNPWDLSPSVHRALTHQVLHYLTAKGEVEVVSQDKQEFFDRYSGEPPALVFLDADHRYEATKTDIRWAKRVGAAIICGHDYADHCPGVGRAVEEEGGTARHSHGLWALNTFYWQQPRVECPREAA